MNEIMILCLSLFAGAMLAVLFLYLLKQSLQRLSGRSRPGLWLFGSILGRQLLILGCLYIILYLGGWSSLLVAALGFIVMRSLLMRFKLIDIG